MPDVSQFITDPPLALLFIVILSGIIALGRGLVVPKPIYDREVKRADKSEETNALMLASQRDMTQSLKDLTSEVMRK